MFQKKPDPREEMIAFLKQQLVLAQSENSELRKQLLSLTDRASYRDLYPKMVKEVQEGLEKKIGRSLPVDPRRRLYVPKNSAAQVTEMILQKEKES
jgi:hypothetical protein